MLFELLLFILTMLPGDGRITTNLREPAKPIPERRVCVFVETPSGLAKRCG